MTKNLTEGNPLKLIIDFSIPLLLGTLFQQTYNMADAALVGQYLGSNSLAAVGASSSVQFLVLGFCMGLCAGLSIPIAQRFGAQDYSVMRVFIFNGCIITLFFAVVFTALTTIFCTQILQLLSTPQNIFKEAYIYLVIIFAGIPFSMLYNLLAGYLRAVGDSRTPFIFLVISTIVNIVLDVVFMVIFKIGVAGAALATITSQALSGILCLVYILTKCQVLHLKKIECRIEGDKIAFLLKMGIPTGLQYSITAIGSMVLQASNNKLGELYVSGFTAGSKLKQLAMCPFDALATSVATFASQNYGAHKMDRIKKGIIQGTAIGVVYGAVAGLILIFFGTKMSLMFVKSTDVDVLNASGHYVAILGCFSWCLGFLNVLRMTTQGLGYSNRAIFSGVVEMFARCIVSFGFVPFFGYNAVCFADPTAWITAVMYITPTCIICLKKIEKEINEWNKNNPDKVNKVP